MDDAISKQKQAASPALLSARDPSYHAAASPSVVSPSADALTLALDVRRSVVSVSTVASVAVILLLTLLFQHGMELKTYEGAMAASDRDALLDRYNGYTGNVATAVSRPLEVMITALLQFFILRFLASALLQPEPKWSVGLVALALSAALGFLLNSGFNALNVQLRDLDVEPFIDLSDLVSSQSNASTVSDSAVTTVANAFSELQPANAVANTVLRNLVLPRTPKSPTQCTMATRTGRPADDSIDFGISQYEWMKQLLPRALDTTSLRVTVNATDVAANRDVKPSALPMNASTAADLFIAAALVSEYYIPWGKANAWDETLRPELATGLGEKETLPTALAAGLLPPERDASENDKRDWLLRAVQTFFTKRPIATINMTRTDVHLDFAHVDLSPSVTSDSLTLTAEVDPTLYTELLSNDTQRVRYANVGCRMFPGVYTSPRLANDRRSVIHVFAACANDDGSETLQSLPRGSNKFMSDFYVQCPRRSNSSLLVLSTSKRLYADSVLENTYAGTTALSASNGSCVATNLRKAYSFTVNRITWTSQDLAQKFNATCKVAGGCQGLDTGLADGTRLVVGNEGLPLNFLAPLGYDSFYTEIGLNPLSVVSVNEPIVAGSYTYGDLLLTHNLRNASAKFPRARPSGDSCRIDDEDRQQLVLNNHMYMESTLQTSYTAAMFFLFQNGVVREPLGMRSGRDTLAFNGNLQKTSLWVSIPTSNALQTCAGCFLLVAGLLAALLWTHRKARTASDPLQAITTPQVIARVMLDGKMFPATMVHRRVVVDSDGCVEGSDVDNFYIESLTLKRRNGAGDDVNGHV